MKKAFLKMTLLLSFLFAPIHHSMAGFNSMACKAALYLGSNVLAYGAVGAVIGHLVYPKLDSFFGPGGGSEGDGEGNGWYDDEIFHHGKYSRLWQGFNDFKTVGFWAAIIAYGADIGNKADKTIGSKSSFRPLEIATYFGFPGFWVSERFCDE